MGVIITIREKFMFVLTAVIALAIIGFLFMDATQSNTNVFQPDSNKAGSINGNDITYPEYTAKVDEALQKYRLNNDVANVPDNVMNDIREQAWEEYVRTTLMGNQYEVLGIKVTGEEVYEMFQGSNPHPMVAQQFRDPNTGTFSPQQISMFLQNIDNDDPNGMTAAEKRLRWRYFEEFVKQNRLDTKYNQLVSKSFYAPTWMAKQFYQYQATTQNVNYVMVPYSSIPDDQVQVTDADLKKYLEEHADQFKQEKGRVINYVVFNLKPSKQDTAAALKFIEEKKESFTKTTTDSLFVKLNSDRNFDPGYYGRDELASSMIDTFFSVDTNVVIGPYFEDSIYAMAKVLDRKMIPDSVKARQIYFPVTSQEEITTKKALADSLKIEIEEGRVGFEEVFFQNMSDDIDLGSGGDMGWVKPGEQFFTIDRALFYQQKEGEIFVVPGEQGFHLIEITEADPTKEAVKVAIVTRKIVPSKSTGNARYTEVNEFRMKHNTADAFKNAESVNVVTSPPISINSYQIPGVKGDAREVVKWAFNANKGDVSDPFILEDKYIVAQLENVMEEGTASVENVKGQLEVLVKQQKKAELIKEKLKGASSLDAIANSNNTMVNTATNINLDNYSFAMGQEPKVAGAAMALEPNTISKPIEGKAGVYVIQVTSREPATEQPGYTMQQQQLQQILMSVANQRLFEAIKEVSEVEDIRYKFY